MLGPDVQEFQVHPVGHSDISACLVAFVKMGCADG